MFGVRGRIQRYLKDGYTFVVHIRTVDGTEVKDRGVIEVDDWAIVVAANEEEYADEVIIPWTGVASIAIEVSDDPHA